MPKCLRCSAESAWIKGAPPREPKKLKELCQEIWRTFQDFQSAEEAWDPFCLTILKMARYLGYDVQSLIQRVETMSNLQEISLGEILKKVQKEPD